MGNTSEIIRSLGVTDLVNVTAIYISNELVATKTNANVKVLYY